MNFKSISLVFVLISFLGLNGGQSDKFESVHASAYDKLIEEYAVLLKRSGLLLDRISDASDEGFWAVVTGYPYERPSKDIQALADKMHYRILFDYYNRVVKSDPKKKQYIDEKLKKIKSGDCSKYDLLLLGGGEVGDIESEREAIEKAIKKNDLLSSKCLNKYVRGIIDLNNEELRRLKIRKKDISKEGFLKILVDGPLYGLDQDDPVYLEKFFQLLFSYVECSCEDNIRRKEFFKNKLRNYDSSSSSNDNVSRLARLYG